MSATRHPLTLTTRKRCPDSGSAWRSVVPELRRSRMIRSARALFAVVAVVAIGGCGSGGSGSTPTAATTEAQTATTTAPTEAASTAATTAPTEAALTEAASTGAALTEAAPADARIESDVVNGRRFEVNVPAGYDGSTPVPLVVALHGYTGTAAGAKSFFGLDSEAARRGVLTVYPDGTKDQQGSQFWNATDACCRLTSTDSDDSAYLTALIDQVVSTYNVDPKRVFLVGHSNGGFMSYRMACEHADRIAAIVSVAGATFGDVAACKPSEPVSVVQVHGTADVVISFSGGSIRENAYPSATTTVASWASYNTCATGPLPSPRPKNLDLDGLVEGVDSTVVAFEGCPSGGAVELWTIESGSHGPQLTEGFASSIMDFLLAHPKA